MDYDFYFYTKQWHNYWFYAEIWQPMWSLQSPRIGANGLAKISPSYRCHCIDYCQKKTCTISLRQVTFLQNLVAVGQEMLKICGKACPAMVIIGAIPRLTETAGKAGKTVASGGQINHFCFYNIFGRFEQFYPKFELSKPTRVLASPEISMYWEGVYLLRTAAKSRNMVFVVMFLTIIDIIVCMGWKLHIASAAVKLQSTRILILSTLQSEVIYAQSKSLLVPSVTLIVGLQPPTEWMQNK